MAAIAAGRAARAAATPLRIIALDGAQRLGAKILVSGGGRCNVTHAEVSERDFNGSTPAAIRRVLSAFSVRDTVDFFEGIGVPLVREPGGKLFPRSNRARDVLDALIAEVSRVNVVLQYPWRVTAVERQGDVFRLHGPGTCLDAARVVVTTGGMSLPKSGSDGQGYELVRALGHTTTDAIFPALVPLALESQHTRLTQLAGVSSRVALEVRDARGKRLVRITGDLLCTHRGVSGPAVLDISRHLIAARRADPGAALVVNWLPDVTATTLDQSLRELGPVSVAASLRRALPERLAVALCETAGVPPAMNGHTLTREARLAIVRTATEMTLPVSHDLGFTVAEVTAGGVPLQQLRLDSLESRITPGLHLAGEICDVDGRIGGFNFQWAWASGHVAGRGAFRALVADPTRRTP